MELRPKGSRNPATGGDACFSVQHEFNGFARQGVMAGTEYERYFAFQDVPAYEKDYATGWKILAGIATAIVVGVAIGALAFATGGLALPILGMTAAQFAVGVGVITAGAGMLATFGTCLNDWRNGTTSSIFDYMGNSYTASVTVGGALEALYLSMTGAEALTYLITGGSMSVPVFGTVISTKGIMAAVASAVVGSAKLNVGFQLYDLCLFLMGEKPLRAPTGNRLYDTAKAWTETISTYIAFLGLQNPRTYGPTYERLPGAVDTGASRSTALTTQNIGIANMGGGSGAGGMALLPQRFPEFTTAEIDNLKKTVISEAQMLKDMGLTTGQLGPAIAGAYDKSTGKIYTAINNYDGDIPSELSPVIKERVKNMPLEILDFCIETKGAGSHAEVYAVNKLLLDNPDAKISDILIYVNRTLGVSKPVKELPFKTCPHCKYILEKFKIFSDN